MKIIYNNIIPFEGYKAINLFGVLFVREKFEGKISDKDINHESIHTEQIKELWYVPFYILYFLEWLFRFFFTKDMGTHNAYKHISFEREAYDNERNLRYLETRKHFSQWRKKTI